MTSTFKSYDSTVRTKRCGLRAAEIPFGPRVYTRGLTLVSRTSATEIGNVGYKTTILFESQLIKVAEISSSAINILKVLVRQLMHWDTFKQDNYSTVGGDGGCRVCEVRAGTTSPMPDHKGFKLR